MSRGPEQTFFWKTATDGQRHMKGCSVSLIIRDTQNHSEMSPHTCQNGRQKDRQWQALLATWHRGTLLPCLWDYKLVQPLWKNRILWRFLKRLKTELPRGPAIPLSGSYPKEMRTQPEKHACTPVFTAAYLPETCRQPVPVRGWMDKGAHAHIHTVGHCSAIKRKTLPFETTWMELEAIMLSEISHTGKDNYLVISLLCRT